MYLEAYYSQKDAEYCREQHLGCEASNHKIDPYGVCVVYCGQGASASDEAKTYEVSEYEEGGKEARADVCEAGCSVVRL